VVRARPTTSGLDQARLEVVKDAGHLPQIEQPAATFALIDDYVSRRQ
jgi:pimeloyl-ACP methyl ester carboxylesterase